MSTARMQKRLEKRLGELEKYLKLGLVDSEEYEQLKRVVVTKFSNPATTIQSKVAQLSWDEFLKTVLEANFIVFIISRNLNETDFDHIFQQFGAPKKATIDTPNKTRWHLFQGKKSPIVVIHTQTDEQISEIVSTITTTNQFDNLNYQTICCDFTKESSFDSHSKIFSELKVLTPIFLVANSMKEGITNIFYILDSLDYSDKWEDFLTTTYQKKWSSLMVVMCQHNTTNFDVSKFDQIVASSGAKQVLTTMTEESEHSTLQWSLFSWRACNHTWAIVVIHGTTLSDIVKVSNQWPTRELTLFYNFSEEWELKQVHIPQSILTWKCSEKLLNHIQHHVSKPNLSEFLFVLPPDSHYEVKIDFNQQSTNSFFAQMDFSLFENAHIDAVVCANNLTDGLGFLFAMLFSFPSQKIVEPVEVTIIYKDPINITKTLEKNLINNLNLKFINQTNQFIIKCETTFSTFLNLFIIHQKAKQRNTYLQLFDFTVDNIIHEFAPPTKLQQLKKKYEEKLITEEEYEQARQVVLLGYLQKPKIKEPDQTTKDSMYKEVKLHYIPQFLPVEFLEHAVERSKAVCVIGKGTGFVVAKAEKWVYLLTACHVIPTQEDIGSYQISAKFFYQTGAESFALSLDPGFYKSSPYSMEVSQTALDFALVRCQDPEGKLANVLPIPLVEPKTIPDIVNIIGHPDGRLKEVVLRQNEILIDQSNDFMLRYKVETEKGSSGSPVFNDHWELVGLHHVGSTGNKYNQCVNIKPIIGHLKSLNIAHLNNFTSVPLKLEMPPPGPLMVLHLRKSDFKDDVEMGLERFRLWIDMECGHVVPYAKKSAYRESGERLIRTMWQASDYWQLEVELSSKGVVVEGVKSISQKELSQNEREHFLIQRQLKWLRNIIVKEMKGFEDPLDWHEHFNDMTRTGQLGELTNEIKRKSSDFYKDVILPRISTRELAPIFKVAPSKGEASKYAESLSVDDISRIVDEIDEQSTPHTISYNSQHAHQETSQRQPQSEDPIPSASFPTIQAQQARCVDSLTKKEISELSQFLNARTRSGTTICVELARRLDLSSVQIDQVERHPNQTVALLQHIMSFSLASSRERSLDHLINKLLEHPPFYPPAEYLVSIQAQQKSWLVSDLTQGEIIELSKYLNAGLLSELATRYGMSHDDSKKLAHQTEALLQYISLHCPANERTVQYMIEKLRLNPPLISPAEYLEEIISPNI